MYILYRTGRTSKTGTSRVMLYLIAGSDLAYVGIGRTCSMLEFYWSSIFTSSAANVRRRSTANLLQFAVKKARFIDGDGTKTM